MVHTFRMQRKSFPFCKKHLETSHFHSITLKKSLQTTWQICKHQQQRRSSQLFLVLLLSTSSSFTQMQQQSKHQIVYASATCVKPTLDLVPCIMNMISYHRTSIQHSFDHQHCHQWMSKPTIATWMSFFCRTHMLQLQRHTKIPKIQFG